MNKIIVLQISNAFVSRKFHVFIYMQKIIMFRMLQNKLVNNYASVQIYTKYVSEQ